MAADGDIRLPGDRVVEDDTALDAAHDGPGIGRVLDQLSDPDRVVDAGLAAGSLDDLGGVGQETRARLLQDVEHRPLCHGGPRAKALR